jgi:hypothetical protein
MESINKNWMRARRVLFRLWMKVSGNTRPASNPYVSGDSFRALASHVHDETGQFDPLKVGKGDIVFVSTPLILSYMQSVHPLIQHPYVLISHNGDTPIEQPVIDLLDDKIIRLYAQYATLNHEKIVHLPIGLENLHYYVAGIPSEFNKLRRRIKARPPVRRNRIFFRFSVSTNPSERGPALEYFSAHPLMETVSGMLPASLHLRKLMTYKFVASPRGNGRGSSRTWEALYLGTIPLVSYSVSKEYFASLGLPLWVVRDWKELDGYSEKDLAEKYDGMMRDARWDALFMDFWTRMICADQEKTLA